MKSMRLFIALLALSAFGFCQTLTPVIDQKGKWGYQNEKNEMVIEYQFLNADRFTGNMARVVTDKGPNLINKSGTLLINIPLDGVYMINEKLCYITDKKNNKNLVNDEGKLLSDKWFTYISQPNNGFIFVQIGDKNGVLNDSGEKLTDVVYSTCQTFTKNYFVVKGEKGYAFFDKTGALSSESWFDDMTFTRTENMLWAKKGTKYGFVDETGKTVLPFEYDGARSFSEKLAAVKKGTKWGFIDVTGKVIIDYNYENVSNGFSEGLCEVSMNFKSGFIDLTGKTVIDYQYDYAADFFMGYSYATIEEKYGIIDKNGKTVIPFVYTDISYDHEFILENFGFFPLMKDKNYVLVSPVLEKEISPEFTLYHEDMGYENIPFFLMQDKKGKWAVANTKPGMISGFEFDLVDLREYYIFEFIRNSRKLIVKKDKSYAIIDTTGSFVLSGLKNIDLESISNGYKYIKYEKAGKFGFFNDSMTVTTPCIFTTIDMNFLNDWGFDCTYAQKDGKYCIVDISGKIRIDGLDAFNSAYMENESEIFITSKNGKFGAINREFQVVIPFEYQDIFPKEPDQLYGIQAIMCKKDGKYGLVSVDGTPIKDFIYEKVEVFDMPLYKGYRDGKWYVVDGEREVPENEW